VGRCVIAVRAMNRCGLGGALLAVALGAASLSACDCGRESGDPVLYAGGTRNAARTRYASSELHGIWLHFPAGRRYRLYHGLGAVPDDVFVYLAFREDPLRLGETGNISPAVGNVALVEAVEREYVQVRNDTCSEFYVRVVVEVASPPADGAGGAGAAAAGGAAGSAD
jgi:hypothetical protein